MLVGKVGREQSMQIARFFKKIILFFHLTIIFFASYGGHASIRSEIPFL